MRNLFSKFVLWLITLTTLVYNVCDGFSVFRIATWYGEGYELDFPVVAYVFILIWAGFSSVILNKIVQKLNKSKAKVGIKVNLSIMAILIGIMLGIADTSIVLVCGMVLTALVMLTIPMVKSLYKKA